MAPSPPCERRNSRTQVLAPRFQLFDTHVTSAVDEQITKVDPLAMRFAVSAGNGQV